MASAKSGGNGSTLKGTAASNRGNSVISAQVAGATNVFGQ